MEQLHSLQSRVIRIMREIVKIMGTFYLIYEEGVTMT